MKNYQEFAEFVQDQLKTSDIDWKKHYAGYAVNMVRNEQRAKAAGSAFRTPKPLCCYLTLGEAQTAKNWTYSLRYLGQTVASVKVQDKSLKIEIDQDLAENNRKFWSFKLGDFSEDWSTGEKAKAFRKHFKALENTKEKRALSPEHTVESALFSELEKTSGVSKALCGIQPIRYGGTRTHMKTALSASQAKNNKVSVKKSGGEIDLFCRQRQGNRARLTVVEIKDENKPKESPEKAIKQAIAYAVFIRELVRSESGPAWMKLWGMENQPWEDGFTINAVVAMPKKDTDDLSFAHEILRLGRDRIQLHYISFLGDARDGADVPFETSLRDWRAQ